MEKDCKKLLEEALDEVKLYYNNAKEFGDYKTVARIESKFPQLKESEDERIRKSLIKDFRNYYEMYDKSCGEPKWGSDSLLVKDILDWFEKHKEQKSAEWDDKDLPQGGESIMIRRILHSLMLYREMLKDSNFEKDYIKTTVNNCLEDEKWLSSFLETSQKPAEWSEEDKEILNAIVVFISGYADKRVVNKWVKFLKSFRP